MSSIPLRRLLHGSVLLIVLLSGSFAHARIWRDINGNEIEGEFVRKDGSMVTLLVEGEERTYPISTFSSLDKTYISRQKNPGPSATPNTPQPNPLTPATPENPNPLTPAIPENTPPVNPNPPIQPRPPQANVPPAEFRIWRTVDGQRIRAKYFSFDAETREVTLELDTGRRDVYPLNDFSFADKEEVNRQVAAAARANLPETPIASNTPEPSNTFPETPESTSPESPRPRQTTRPRPSRNTPSGESWARFVHRRKAGPVALAEVLPQQPAVQQPPVASPTTPTPSVTPTAPAPTPVVSTGQPLMNQVTYGDSSEGSSPITLVAIVLVIAAVGGFVYTKTRG